MRFRGLPADLHVAEAELIPVTPCVLLLPCASCSYVCPSFYVCMKNHIVCTACSVQGTSAPNTIWCPICRQVSVVTTVSIDREMLGLLRFRCKCGLEKTLGEFRLHILEEGLHEGSTKPAAPDSNNFLLSGQADLDLRIRSIACEEVRKLKHEIEPVDRIEEERHPLLQKLESDRTEAFQKTEEDKRELMALDKSSAYRGSRSRPVINLEILNETLNAMRDELDNLKCCRAATAPRAFFWFDFEEICKRFQASHESMKTGLQQTFISGIPFQACLKVWSVDKKEYLDICGGRSDHSDVDIPLPLNRKVILSIHDSNGRPIATKSCNSVIGNQYLFRFGSKEAGLSRTTKLIELSTVTKSCLVNGKLMASIEILPMD